MGARAACRILGVSAAETTTARALLVVKERKHEAGVDGRLLHKVEATALRAGFVIAIMVIFQQLNAIDQCVEAVVMKCR